MNLQLKLHVNEFCTRLIHTLKIFPTLFNYKILNNTEKNICQKLPNYLEMHD